MKKFEVGYPDEMIGIYFGESPEEAIAACKEEITSSGYKSVTPIKDRIGGMITVEVLTKDACLEDSSSFDM